MFTIENPIDLDNDFVGTSEIDDEVTLVIDLDEQVFITAAACEERMVEVQNTTSFDCGLFKNRTEFKSFMKGIDYNEDMFTMEDVQKAEKISHAISTLKRRLENIRNKCKCHPDNVEYYIGGSNNFRDALPLAAKYKGDREGTLKPLLLKELREYCINYLGAEVINHMECDDMITIRISEGFRENKKVVGCSQDKDMYQVSGWVFNYEKDNEPRFIKGFGELYIDSSLKSKPVKGTGRKFLYFQLLFGDKADCYDSRDVYKSLHGKKPRYGELSAYKELAPLNTDKECLEHVVNKYKKWYGEDVFTYKTWDGWEIEADWLNVLELQFMLAYMKQRHNDSTCIRKVLKKIELI